jgi:hypothetical protein
MPLHFPPSVVSPAAPAHPSSPAAAEAPPDIAVNAKIHPELEGAHEEFEAMEELEKVTEGAIKQVADNRGARMQTVVARRQEIERFHDRRDKEAQREIQSPFHPFEKPADDATL